MSTLTTSARCLQAGCDWGVAGAAADRAAETHTKRERHATVTSSVPLLRVPEEGA